MKRISRIDFVMMSSNVIEFLWRFKLQETGFGDWEVKKIKRTIKLDF